MGIAVICMKLAVGLIAVSAWVVAAWKAVSAYGSFRSAVDLLRVSGLAAGLTYREAIKELGWTVIALFFALLFTGGLFA